jgi:DNA-binding GntR family transcriptional regulator
LFRSTKLLYDGVVSTTDVAELSVPSAERVAASLRDEILSGALPPGTPLREAALAAELAVSRNTFREALRLLGAEGLIEQQLYKGAVVASMPEARIRDLYLVRRTLELRAVEESGTATPAALAAVHDAVCLTEAAEAAGDWRAVGTHSLRFHGALVATLGSPMLDSFFHGVTAQQRLAFAAVADEARLQGPWTARDREICDLLRAGFRAAAGAALRRYLDDSERMLVQLTKGS